MEPTKDKPSRTSFEVGTTSCIDGYELTFVRVIRGVGALHDVVLCRDGHGEEFCASREEWQAGATKPHVVPECTTPVAVGSAPEKAIVTRGSPTIDKVRLFRSLFHGNDDAYAHAYANRKTGGIGYVPACANEWRPGVCGKRRGAKCDACPHRKLLPLIDEVILRHLLDRDLGRRDVVGLYPLTADSTCWILVADFDDDGWQEAVAAYRDSARSIGIPCYVERSRSGDGAHAWVFFDSAIPARDARGLGTLLLDDAGRRCSKVGFESYDRLFPTQDYVPKGGLGNLISLPLQRSAVERGASVFVDEEFHAYPDQWEYLSRVERVSASQLQEALALGRKGSRDVPPQVSASLLASAVANPTGLPKAVNITLGSMVSLKREGLSQPLVADIERLAVLANPEFFRKQAMRLRVWGTPRYLWFGDEDDQRIMLPRGCLTGLEELMAEKGVSISVTDERIVPRRLDVEFAGVLRTDQTSAVDALLAHDDGLLVAPTGFGKTVVAAALIAQRGVSTLVIVPRTSLLDQWRESLERFLDIRDEPRVLRTPTGRVSKHQPGQVGCIGGGRRLPSGLVDIALASSLLESGKARDGRRVSDLVRDYGMVIVDEAQHVPAQETMEVLKEVSARYVYGLTATPRRKDGLDKAIGLFVGPIRFKADEIVAQDFERVLVPRFTGVVFDEPSDCEEESRGAFDQDWNAALTFVSEHEERNAHIVRDALGVLEKGGSPLVLTRRVAQARELAEMLESLSGRRTSESCRIVTLVGSDDEDTRKARLAEVENAPAEQPLCVVATGSYVGEGFDCPRLDTLLLAAPVSWEGLLTQFVGRIQRDYQGKRQVVVYDYIDENIPMFTRTWHGRLKVYSRLGYRVASPEGEEDGMPDSHIVDAGEFRDAFLRDLQGACRSVAFSSEWVNTRRIEELMAVLGEMRTKGIKVSVRMPDVASEDEKKVEQALVEVGCEVSRERAGIRPVSFAVLDDSLVWFGGLPMLAYPHRDDCSIRVVNRELAAELIARIGKNRV